MVLSREAQALLNQLPPDLRDAALQEAIAKAYRDKAAAHIYDSFKRKYRYDPAGFVVDCIQFVKAEDGPADYQLESMANIVKYKRHSDRGPHGTGKTAISSWLVLWFALTRDGEDWKALTTASAWRQLSHFLWPEIHKWARHIKWDKIGRAPFDKNSELLTLQLSLDTGQAFALASSDHTLIEGAHADQLLYIFDESKSIKNNIFDAAEGAFSGAWGDTSNEAYAYAVSTPGEEAGRFWQIQTQKPGYEDWNARKIDIDRVIAARRISKDWQLARRNQWGEKSQLYTNRVLADFFPKTADRYVIPLSWVELAQQRWLDRMESGFVPDPFDLVIGADIGGEGDLNTLAEVYGDFVKTVHIYPKDDTMQVSGQIVQLITPNNRPAVIDSIGKGAGVLHRLREQGLDVWGFVASEGTKVNDMSGELKFRTKRSAAWWGLREALDPENDPTLCLPPDNVVSEKYSLSGELTTPKWKPLSNGIIYVQSKQDIKDDLGADLGRSTDIADAILQALFLPTLRLEGDAEINYNTVRKIRRAREVLGA